MKNLSFIKAAAILLGAGLLACLLYHQHLKTINAVRAREAWIYEREWALAENIYYLKNGEYTWNLKLLDTPMPDLHYFGSTSFFLVGSGIEMYVRGYADLKDVEIYTRLEKGKIVSTSCHDAGASGKCKEFLFCKHLALKGETAGLCAY